MYKNKIIELKAAAEKFRKRQRPYVAQPEEFTDDLDEDDLDEEYPLCEPTLKKSTSIKAIPTLYSSKDVKIFISHIEVDNLTYAISYIASIKRIEKKPPIYECMLSMGFIIISLVALVTYLVLGKLKLGLLAVSYLSLILIAFLVLSIICQELRSTYFLELYNFNGEVVERISSLSKSTVSKIEKAIKTAIAAKQ